MNTITLEELADVLLNEHNYTTNNYTKDSIELQSGDNKELGIHTIEFDLTETSEVKWRIGQLETEGEREHILINQLILSCGNRALTIKYAHVLVALLMTGDVIYPILEIPELAEPSLTWLRTDVNYEVLKMLGELNLESYSSEDKNSTHYHIQLMEK